MQVQYTRVHVKENYKEPNEVQVTIPTITTDILVDLVPLNKTDVNICLTHTVRNCASENTCIYVSQNVYYETEQKTFEIFGDSYSSFIDDIVYSECAYYGIEETADIVGTVIDSEDMWYSIVEEKLGWEMVRNDSVSGSCLSYSYYGDERNDPTGKSFITRIIDRFEGSGSELEDPDVIFIFGGTNDNWANAPLGEVMYSDWTDEGLNSILPAACFIFDYISNQAPDTEIVFIMNTFDDNIEMTEKMKEVCEYYGVTCVDWCEGAVEKESLHPTIDGMVSIADNIIYTLLATPVTNKSL